MAKYSFGLKLKIVKAYMEGAGGYNYLADKYGISDQCLIKRWVNSYKEFGEEGLYRKRKNDHYPVQFKLNAVEL